MADLQRKVEMALKKAWTLVEAKQLRPLNHDYLPNSKFLWSQFLPPGPSYDAGMRYTTPYTIFTTGIGWRADLVDPADAPDQLENPYDLLWNPKYTRGFSPSYREVLAIIEKAFRRDAEQRAAAARLAGLTERERAVMQRIIEGKANKVIAAELDISVKTVEYHRAKLMEKTGASSVAELVVFAMQHPRAGAV